MANPEGGSFRLVLPLLSRWNRDMETMEPSIAAPLVLLVVVVFGLAMLGLWVWSLIHCIQNRYLNDNNRLIGILLIILLGLIGSLVYLFLPRETQAQR